tara:strand:+ start:618 stop:866 length:249 start_codon:yes stop_codon:yes gene_type:complete
MNDLHDTLTWIRKIIRQDVRNNVADQSLAFYFKQFEDCVCYHKPTDGLVVAIEMFIEHVEKERPFASKEDCDKAVQVLTTYL